MTAKQYHAMRLLIEGKTQQQVADEVGVNRNTIGNWLRNAEFKEEYDRQVKELMSVLAGEALANLAELMRNASSESVRLNACKDILSRAGFDATAKSKLELEKPMDIIINIE